MQTFAGHLRFSLVTIGVLLGLAYFERSRGEGDPTTPLERAVEVMGRSGLSEIDEDALTAGYYEALLDEGQRSRANSRSLLTALRAGEQAPPNWVVLAKTEAARQVGGFLQYDLRPNTVIPFKGDSLRVNRWGLRDREYTLEKPPGTYRMALVGASYTMGTGVPMEQTYQALLERRLASWDPCPAIDAYEVLNFSVAGYRITQLMELAVERVPRFDPDVVIFVVNRLAIDDNWSKHLVTLVRQGEDLKYDFLREIAEKARLRRSDSPAKLMSKLAPYRAEVIAGTIATAKAAAEAHGATLVLLQLPATGASRSLNLALPEIVRQLPDAESIPVIDALDAFAGARPDDLWIATWDHHPNAMGHELLVDRIFAELQSNAPAILRCTPGATGD